MTLSRREQLQQIHDIERVNSLFEEEPRLPVLLLTPRWSPVILVDPTSEDLCFVGEEKEGWMLYVRAFVDDELAAFSVPVNPRRYEIAVDGSMAAFGLRQLGPGTWRVVPSINIPGQIHAFVILCCVPDPAPWEGLHGASR